jgi:hypothetical protein
MRTHRSLLGFVLGSALAVGACTSSDGYVLVTVAAPAAVHDAKSLTIALANGGTTRMDNLALRDQAFPVTFSITAPGRTGDLEITVDATDANGLVVGHGTATTTTAASSAGVQLDATDFVVNTDYAGDQFPSDDSEAGGFQLAALPDGTWTVAFGDSCPTSSCSLYARRFDKTGKPVQTQAAAGTNAFVLTAKPTESSSTPALTSGRAATLALWNFADVGTATTSGVACRSLDASGRLGADQTTIESVGAYVVSAAAMSNDNFVATWRILGPGVIDEIHTAVLKPDCTVLGAVQTVAKGAVVADFLHRGSVASSADHVLLTWITNGDIHTRMASNAGVFSTADTLLVPQTATDEITAVRAAAATGGGFVLAGRWAQKSTSTGTGRIQLYRVDATGALIGTPTLVTDKTGSDFTTSKTFSMASRPDGTLMIAWHACGDLGDGNKCGVFGRILRDTGAPVTDVFLVPTTIDGDQQLPSVAGLPDAFVVTWADASSKPPDMAGQSVRARIIYPPGN